MPQDTNSGAELDDTLNAGDDTLDNANDTLAAGEGDDTEIAAGDDTLASGGAGAGAGAGSADTANAGEGDDTIALARADDDGFAQFDDPPVAKPGKGALAAGGDAAGAGGENRGAAGRQARETRETALAGETDDELAALEQDVDELDTTLGASGKLKANFKKLIDRDRAKDKKLEALEQRTKAAENENAWTQFEEQLKIPDSTPAVQKLLARPKLKERFSKHFNQALAAGCSPEEARGEARATLKAEVRQIQKQHARKPAPRVATNSAGSRLSPPGGGGSGSRQKPRASAEDAFDNGDWNYPA